MVQNIVIITQYFAPAWSYGGPPRVLYTLAKELVKQGKNVMVITSDALDERRNPILKERFDGIEVYRFKTFSNSLAYRMKVFIVPRILRQAKNNLDKADFVFFSDTRSIMNWQLYPYVAKNKIPYGIFAFGTIPYGFGAKTFIKKMLDRWWVTDFIKRASFRFAQTEHEQAMYRKFFGLKLSETQLVPLPLERKEYPIDRKELARFKKSWNIKNDDKVLLFVGRLHYLKGVDILIKAVEPLLEKDKRLILLIVGRDDGEEENLRRLTDNRVDNQIIFTGPLYDEKVAYAYSLASCFVFTPRFYEETSSAALEALSFGVPVITTKEAKIPFLEQYRAGFVIENNQAKIRDAITVMLGKIKSEKKEIKKQAISLANEKFLCQTVVNQLLSFIGSLK